MVCCTVTRCATLRAVTLDTRLFDVPSLTLLVIPLLYSGATSRVTQYEFSNRASQATVLPARGCDARKCIKPLAAPRWIFIHNRKERQYGKAQLLQGAQKSQRNDRRRARSLCISYLRQHDGQVRRGPTA